MATVIPARMPPDSAIHSLYFLIVSLSLNICRIRENGSTKANAAIIVRIRL